MKKIFMRSLIGAAVMVLMFGCGGPSKEERKKSLTAKIEAYGKSGFDVRKAEESAKAATYVFHVRDVQKAYDKVLAGLASGIDNPALHKLISEMAAGSDFGVDVDWERYLAGKDDSIYIYYMGKKGEKTNPVFASFLKDKKLGVYLSLDEKDRMKKAGLKDIDEQFANGKGTMRLSVKNTKLSVRRHVSNEPFNMAYSFDAGVFDIEMKLKKGEIFTISSHDLHCDVDMNDIHLGAQHCVWPKFSLKAGKLRQNVGIVLENLDMDYMAKNEARKLEGKIMMKTGKVGINFSDSAKWSKIIMKNLGVDGRMSGADEKSVRKLAVLLHSRNPDDNAVKAEILETFKKILSGGMKVDYLVRLDNIDGKFGDIAKREEADFGADGVEGHYAIGFDKNIEYHESMNVRKMSLDVSGAKQSYGSIDLQAFSYAFEMKDILNFVPEFIGVAEKKLKNPSKNGRKDIESSMRKIGTKVVNHGMAFSLSPISLKSMKAVEPGGKKYDYSKMRADMNVRLSANNLDFSNPMAAMALLGYVNGKGRIVLAKKDLDHMLSSMPGGAGNMVMMYARQDGDNAVFDIKIEKGHLEINGKPVM